MAKQFKTADAFKKALEAHMRRRAAALNRPPEQWRNEFVAMAAEAGISTTDYLAAFELLERFWADNSLGAPAA